MARGSKNVSLQCLLIFFSSSVGADLSRCVDSKLLPRLDQAVDHHPWCSGGQSNPAVGLVPAMRCRPGLPVFKMIGLSRHLTEANIECGTRRNSFQHMDDICATRDWVHAVNGLCSKVKSSITEGSRGPGPLPSLSHAGGEAARALKAESHHARLQSF